MSRYIDADKIIYSWRIDPDGQEHDGVTLQSIINKMPSIDAVPVQDGILKARKGDYVTYRIDYLLDHLAMEIYLLEGYMRERKES